MCFDVESAIGNVRTIKPRTFLRHSSALVILVVGEGPQGDISPGFFPERCAVERTHTHCHMDE